VGQNFGQKVRRIFVCQNSEVHPKFFQPNFFVLVIFLLSQKYVKIDYLEGIIFRGYKISRIWLKFAKLSTREMLNFSNREIKYPRTSWSL